MSATCGAYPLCLDPLTYGPGGLAALLGIYFLLALQTSHHSQQVELPAAMLLMFQSPRRHTQESIACSCTLLQAGAAVGHMSDASADSAELQEALRWTGWRLAQAASVHTPALHGNNRVLHTHPYIVYFMHFASEEPGIALPAAALEPTAKSSRHLKIRLP